MREELSGHRRDEQLTFLTQRFSWPPVPVFPVINVNNGPSLPGWLSVQHC